MRGLISNIVCHHNHITILMKTKMEKFHLMKQGVNRSDDCVSASPKWAWVRETHRGADGCAAAVCRDETGSVVADASCEDAKPGIPSSRGNTPVPTKFPTPAPTNFPAPAPVVTPTGAPTKFPTPAPAVTPTGAPTSTAPRIVAYPYWQDQPTQQITTPIRFGVPQTRLPRLSIR